MEDVYIGLTKHSLVGLKIKCFKNTERLCADMVAKLNKRSMQKAVFEELEGVYGSIAGLANLEKFFDAVVYRDPLLNIVVINKEDELLDYASDERDLEVEDRFLKIYDQFIIGRTNLKKMFAIIEAKDPTVGLIVSDKRQDAFIYGLEFVEYLEAKDAEK